MLAKSAATMPTHWAALCLCKRCRMRSVFLVLALLSIVVCAILLTQSTATVRFHRQGASDSLHIPRIINKSTSLNISSPSVQTAPNFPTDRTGVVQIFHQSWKTSQLPPRFRRWSQSFASCHPTWQRRLWTDADNEDLIVRHFPWFLPTYRKFSWPVQKADVSRLFYMYKFGGVYCDLDCECLRPFGHLLGNVSLAFGAMDGHTIGPEDGRYVEEGQIENSFMYSIPEHPFIMRLIKLVEQNPTGNPEDTTGPYMMMREIHRMRRTKTGIPREFRGKKYLEIFPPSYFNPYSWISNKVPACKDKGFFSRSDENACRAAHLSNSASFILQYHTQVWQGGSKNLNKD